MTKISVSVPIQIKSKQTSWTLNSAKFRSDCTIYAEFDSFLCRVSAWLIFAFLRESERFVDERIMCRHRCTVLSFSERSSSPTCIGSFQTWQLMAVKHFSSRAYLTPHCSQLYYLVFLSVSLSPSATAASLFDTHKHKLARLRFHSHYHLQLASYNCWIMSN